MPKPPTYPPLYDEVLQLNIADLKKLGYLRPGLNLRGTLNWSSNGNPKASITIHTNTQSEHPYIDLEYKAGGEPRKYKNTVGIHTLKPQQGQNLVFPLSAYK